MNVTEARTRVRSMLGVPTQRVDTVVPARRGSCPTEISACVRLLNHYYTLICLLYIITMQYVVI